MNRLPNELKVGVLEKLDWRSIIQCRAVSREWRNLIDSSVLLIYLVELGGNGKENGPPSNVKTIERLELLRKHSMAWANLSEEPHFEIVVDDGSIYELAGGVYAHSSRGLGQSLQLVQLPSALAKTPKRTWYLQEREINLKDFGMDPEQDLLILFAHSKPLLGSTESYRQDIFFRTLSTNQPHPLAAKPYICHENSEPPRSLTVQIMGDVFGLFYEEPDHVPGILMIWQWTTGQLLSCLKLPGAEQCVSFSFLSDHTLVIPMIEEIDTGDRKACLRVYDFESKGPLSDLPGVGQIHEPLLVSVFEISLLSDQVISGRFESRSDPSPSTTFQPRGSRRAGSTIYHTRDRAAFPDNLIRPPLKPFYPGDDRLFVFHLRLTLFPFSLPSASSISLVTYGSTFSSEVEEGVSLPRVIPWRDWGVKHARFLDAGNFINTLACYVYGDRIVTSLPTVDEEGGIDILDFNPSRVSRARHSMISTPWPSLPLDHPSKISENDDEYAEFMFDDIFMDGEVRANLPYIHTSMQRASHDDAGIMIDDERIMIGIVEESEEHVFPIRGKFAVYHVQ